MSAVDDGLVAVLTGDSTLAGLAPGGVFQDIAPEAAALPYVIWSISVASDEVQFDTTAWEEALYLVKAVSATKAGADTVAARIHALLQDATLTIAGYTSMDVHREDRISYLEADGAKRYYHAGGLYQVKACAGSVGSP